MKEPFRLDADPDRLATHCSDIGIELPVGRVGEVEIAVAEPFHQLGRVGVQLCDTLDAHPIDGLGAFGAYQDGYLRFRLQARHFGAVGAGEELDRLAVPVEP